MALVIATPSLASQGMDQLKLPAIGAPAGSGELSPSDERQIGEESMLQIRGSRYYLDDPDVSEYLNRVGYRLVSQAPSNSYGFLFFPLKVPQINAFAMPGGFIAVFSGTVLAAQDESELASVMAHEIAHVTQRHIARMFENQKGSTAMALGSFLLAVLAGAAGGSSSGDAATAIMMGGQAALLSNQLKFSRSAEQEADRLGFQILVNAGYDPMGMPRFFRRMQDRTMNQHPICLIIRSRLSELEIWRTGRGGSRAILRERIILIFGLSRQGFLRCNLIAARTWSQLKNNSAWAFRTLQEKTLRSRITVFQLWHPD